jgi:hypothetical protein
MSKSTVVVFCSGKAACEFAVDCANNKDRLKLYTFSKDPSLAYKCCHTPAIVKALTEEIECLSKKTVKLEG